jgi:excisionase family DNA binding protein
MVDSGIEAADDMLNLAEASHLLNVHRNTLRKWTNEGTLATVRIGRRGDRRFRMEDITAFLESERQRW